MATSFDWRNCGESNCGPQNRIGGNFENFSSNGMVSLTKCTVASNTSVNGMLILTGSTLNTLDLQGSGTFSDAIVNGIANIKGMINANKSVFHSQLLLNTNYSTFTDTSTRDIVVEDSSDSKVQKIFLKGNTHVQGSITFNRGVGTVIKISSVKIDGSVIGANVVEE